MSRTLRRMADLLKTVSNDSESRATVGRLAESPGLCKSPQNLAIEPHDPKHRATATSRAGYMLVEMVAVIGASIAVMTVAVGLIHSVFDLERSVRGQLAGRQAVDRLAEQFRRDVHAAGQATVEQDPPRCVLRGAGRPEMVYRWEQGQLVREATGDGDSGPSSAASSVAFPLPRSSAVAFELREEAGRTLVALDLGPRSEATEWAHAKPHRLRIEALLDRDTVPPAGTTAGNPEGGTP